MATGTLAIERLPPALGVLRSTMERELRALLVAKFLPAGRPGGGKGSAHLNALHLAYVLIGFAGLRPSEAPDAVRLIRTLPHSHSENEVQGVAGVLPTFEDQLAYWITTAGNARRNGGAWLPDALAVFLSWEMHLCLDPAFAEIRVNTSVGTTRHVWARSSTVRPGLSRVAVVTGNVLLVAADLLVDTEEQRALTTPSFLDPLRANAAPGSNDAGNPRQGVPASIGNQPTPMGPAASPLRKVSAKTKIFKDAPLAGLVTADE